jgi:hypothetical protein
VWPIKIAVEVDEKREEYILAYLNDDENELARDFVNKHGISAAYIQPLA